MRSNEIGLFLAPLASDGNNTMTTQDLKNANRDAWLDWFSELNQASQGNTSAKRVDGSEESS